MDYYIQVECSFPEHPKTYKLAALCGISHDAALLALLRLWCHALRHTHDGCLRDISRDNLVAWTRQSEVTFEALVESGWAEHVDGAIWLHEWKDRYDKVISGRRKAKLRKRKSRRGHADVTRDVTPASRRCSRLEEEEEKDDDSPKGESSSSSPRGASASTGTTLPLAVGGDGEEPSTDQKPTRPRALLTAWNELAGRLGLPKAEALSRQRETHARQRIAEGLLDRWGELAAALEASPFHLGHNDRAWKANFDWLLRPEKWRTLVETASAPREPTGPKPMTAREARWAAELAKVGDFETDSESEEQA